jgi:hypothetical protein
LQARIGGCVIFTHPLIGEFCKFEFDHCIIPLFLHNYQGTPVTMASQKTTETSALKQDENGVAWIYSFAATMFPFTAFCYGHSRGVTGRIVERVVKSPVGVYGLLALPFCTLAMEKSVYDTVQAWQGLDPNVRPKNSGGFPSGGAELPSFSLIPVQKRLIRRPTNMAS